MARFSGRSLQISRAITRLANCLMWFNIYEIYQYELPITLGRVL
jgi:hypothetical protein